MKLTGRNGVLRIYDSADVLHGTAPFDGYTPDMVRWRVLPSGFTNMTSNLILDDTNYETDFIESTVDIMVIGSTQKFSRIKFLKGGGSNYAGGAGALIMKYFNGTDFDNVMPVFTDGTASGGNCFAQDGYIHFNPPRDWALGANAINEAFDSDKYYVTLATTEAPDPKPDADVLCPCDGQYFEVAFSAMDFSGPLGRKLTEEILVLDRQKMSSRAHYIEGADDVLYEPQEISFSCLVDDTYNKDDILIALACGDPDSTYWTATGTTSKGSTKNDGSNDNPAFVDSSKKCVNVQILFEGTTYDIGLAFYEVFFPNAEQSVAESEDGITLSCRGGVYGVVETIHAFGNRY